MKAKSRAVGRVLFLAFVLALPLVHGCAANNHPRVAAAVDDQAFYTWFNKLVDQIRADAGYKRIPIQGTADAEQFLVWMHDVYRHRMSKQDFSELVNSRYPNHQNEVSFILSKLP